MNNSLTASNTQSIFKFSPFSHKCHWTVGVLGLGSKQCSLGHWIWLLGLWSPFYSVAASPPSCFLQGTGRPKNLGLLHCVSYKLAVRAKGSVGFRLDYFRQVHVTGGACMSHGVTSRGRDQRGTPSAGSGGVGLVPGLQSANYHFRNSVSILMAVA